MEFGSLDEGAWSVGWMIRMAEGVEILGPISRSNQIGGKELLERGEDRYVRQAGRWLGSMVVREMLENCVTYDRAELLLECWREANEEEQRRKSIPSLAFEENRGLEWQ